MLKLEIPNQPLKDVYPAFNRYSTFENKESIDFDVSGLPKHRSQLSPESKGPAQKMPSLLG